MELNRALDQISEIHARLQRTEVFRGYRAVPMAFTSVLAIITASLQMTVLAPVGAANSLRLWLGYAAACAVVCGADLASNCWLRGRRFRQQAIFVVSQFVPALVAGTAITALLIDEGPALYGLLPGLWLMVFATGIFSAAPFLPRGLRWVASFYLCAGIWLLWSGRYDAAPTAWSLGLIFATGQGVVAAMLHQDQAGHTADAFGVLDGG